MEDTTIEFKLSILKLGLVNLSKEYTEQIKLFPSFVDPVDEVLSDFEDGFLLLPAIEEENILDVETINLIKKCNELIDINLENQNLLSDKSFQFAEAWQQVRLLASDILKDPQFNY
ncbi:hypothetical protein NU10_02190 [Flavobacterium dauae]|uniref:hypothetical protein n=1 Tax=Flavobacterium dauae TaxID=1563479 RepID=UPI00101B3FAB|nr:hypothetical protein [Flavobacterium dauae]WLD24231.1 hypothetical protein NU10_02190 [Flavobacterium dauae]